jgi:hypothetical protein
MIFMDDLKNEGVSWIWLLSTDSKWEKRLTKNKAERIRARSGFEQRKADAPICWIRAEWKQKLEYRCNWGICLSK